MTSRRSLTEGDFLGFTFQNFTEERTHVGWGYGHAAGAQGAEFMKEVQELTELKFTQREIADQLGVSQTTIGRCLRGKKEDEAPVSL